MHTENSCFPVPSLKEIEIPLWLCGSYRANELYTMSCTNCLEPCACSLDVGGVGGAKWDGGVPLGGCRKFWRGIDACSSGGGGGRTYLDEVAFPPYADDSAV